MGMDLVLHVVGMTADTNELRQAALTASSACLRQFSQRDEAAAALADMLGYLGVEVKTCSTPT